MNPPSAQTPGGGAGDMAVADLLHSWNPRAALRRDQTRRVQVEDDVREALQHPRAARPSLDQRRQMLELSARIGVQVSFLGFPAASPQERDQCAALVTHIPEQGLGLTPVLMARALPEDLRPILDIQQLSAAPVTADLYLSTSPIRAAVEGWDLPTMLGRLDAVARLAAAENLRFRIAFEDSTRTPPATLETCVKAALDLGARCLVLNDTVGDCFPAGARRHTAFVADLIRDAGHRLTHDLVPQAEDHASNPQALIEQSGSEQNPCESGGSDRIQLAWHGHNDKGLALANALAAIEAGATLISGTFLGIGERAGNLALEQLLVVLAAAGNTAYDLTQLVPMGELVAASLGIEIAPHLPILGTDTFSTATGTHAAAIIKAHHWGTDVEDLVYSAVPASLLGRQQKLLVGPNSGRTGARAVLQHLNLPHDDDTVRAVLTHARSVRRTLNDGELIRIALHDRRAT